MTNFIAQVGTTQVIAAGATSAATTNPVYGTYPPLAAFVRLASTTPCHVVFGVTPVATTQGMLIYPGVGEVFKIQANFKVAAIAATGATPGVLSVTAVDA